MKIQNHAASRTQSLRKLPARIGRHDVGAVLFQNVMEPSLLLLRCDQIQAGDEIEILRHAGRLLLPAMHGHQSPHFIDDEFLPVLIDKFLPFFIDEKVPSRKQPALLEE